MNTRRFFTQLPPSGAGTIDVVSITGDELHHLKNVNRARPGDPIEVMDAQGRLCYGHIRAYKGHEAIVDIDRTETTEKPAGQIIVAPSLLKQRPMAILIEKLTELGVHEIRPVIFARTDEKYNPGRLIKWQKAALQSLKVNKQLWATEIHEPVTLEKFIRESLPKEGTRLMLDITGDNPSISTFALPVTAIIGPPGDFLQEERQLLVNNGFMRYNINDAVLKSETAAISIAAILKHSIAAMG